MCPLPMEEPAETAQHLWDGSVVITRTTRQRLVPRTATPAESRWQFCVPQGLGTETAARLLAGDAWYSEVLRSMSLVTALAKSPRIMAAVVTAAVAIALLWVALLRAFTKATLHAQFMLVGLVATAAGSVSLAFGLELLLAEERANSESGGSSRAVVAVFQQVLARMTVLVPPTGPIPFRLDYTLSEYVGVSRPTLLVVCGITLLCIGCLWLLVYLLSRNTISAAADCTKEACRLVFRSPSLLLLIPLLDVALHIAVLVGSGTGLAYVLATATVNPRSLKVLGENVVGVHRGIEWSAELVRGALCWVFAFLWYSELITSLRSFVLSYMAMTWYFRPKKRLAQSLPLLSGMSAALFYHLGSLALGSFVMACIRAAQWSLLVLHRIVGERAEASSCRSGGPSQRCLGCLHVAVQLAKELARRVSNSAYTELALCSSCLVSASWDAAGLLASSPGLVAVRTLVLRPILWLSSAAYAAAFGWCVWAVLASAGPAPSSSSLPIGTWLPPAIVAECEKLGSPAAAAAVAAIVAFVLVREFSAIVDEIADAVLYCFLWDRSDGTVDAQAAPPSFKALVGTMVKPART